MNADKLDDQEKTRRIKILGREELSALYNLPQFTEDEQKHFFSLSPEEKFNLKTFHALSSRIYFILQFGYFKSHQMFFAFNYKKMIRDIRYIKKKYFSQSSYNKFKISKNTQFKQQRLVLHLCQSHIFDTGSKKKLEEKAKQTAMVSCKPIYIFREILNEINKNRTVIPGYTVLQDIVGQAITFEQNRIGGILQKALKEEDRKAFDELLSDKEGVHTMTYLRREPKDFSLGEIKSEIARGKQIKALYYFSKKIVGRLGISSESIKHYASLILYYSVFRLRRFDKMIVYTYLLCFIYHRYQKHHDHLITALIYHTRKFSELAKLSAKERICAYRIEINQNMKKAAQILEIFIDKKIPKNAPFLEVQERAFEILPPGQLGDVVKHINGKVCFDEVAFQWEQIDSLGRRFKRYLRPILLNVNFKGSRAQASLLKGVTFLRSNFEKKRSINMCSPKKIPTDLIPHKQNRYFFIKKTVIPNRYEFFIYKLLRERIEGGDIYCEDSVRFRSFEDDLIDNDQWKKKEEILKNLGLSTLSDPIEKSLSMHEEKLETLIQQVNQHIESNENQDIKITKRGKQTRWSLRYPEEEKEENDPFYEDLKQVDIGNVLNFVNEKCQFIDAFEHTLGRYVKKDKDKRNIMACILAWGTNMGLGKMGQSSDISYNTLASTSENFISLKTLKEANDLVSNSISKMPMFQNYHIEGKVHSSSDGQKFETSISTINARYSPKYFGLKKGVVSYTLVANHVPVNATIIGANEHESHYVFDILANNTSEIQPKIHSTDTHGTNKANFLTLHVFGYKFAPRYSNLFEKVTESLYGFKHPSKYKGLIKPIRKINTKLIISEWGNIQRILVSLALKTTTQSIIMGKLSAYTRKNKTRQAIWEYDSIFRSLHLLELIDFPQTRRNIQKALNRGEGYHQLKRAVAFANFGKLRFKTEYEQKIWGECSRLITNCIIFYNTTILSELLLHKKQRGDFDGANQLKNISPVAWQHINFYGRYEFKKQHAGIDIEALIQEIEGNL